VDDVDAIAGLFGDAGLLDGLRREEKDLAERIEQVREKIAAGEAVLAALERWRQVATPSAAAPEPTSRPDAGNGDELPLIEQVVLLLAQDPDRIWTPEQVHRALDVPAGSVHSTMSRLEQRGRIARVERGAYRSR
jgi:predicted Rossmann fold nucleotide-binding protein DprA/Smf involved in DNA uptake